jgi:acetoin utilization protein AcuB
MFTKLWMQHEVIQVQPDTTIGEAKEILDRLKFRHLPVTDGDTLLGIITNTDLSKAMPSPVDSQASPEDHIIASQVKVSTFMTSNPVTVSAMTPLEEVAKLLKKYKIGAIPVVEENVMIGIITESDLFEAFRAIMDGEADDIRIEMLIDKEQSAFYKVINCCKQFNATINSISLYGDYSSDQQLMTIRINGKQNDKLIEAMWDLGVKINQITQLGEE